MPRTVVLVAGPPCSGKTTYVAQRAGPEDLVLDQDDLGPGAFARALEQVASMVEGAAWVIRCAPGPHARAELAEQVGADDVVLLVPPRAELYRRAQYRPKPRAQVQAIRQWFASEGVDHQPVPRPRTKAKSGDPRLKTPSWQAIVAEWRQRRPEQCQSPRCKSPGQPIQYEGKRGPYHLDVGHVLDRAVDPRRAWRIEETRPEHATCNRAGGADRTNAARRAATERPETARFW